MIAEDFYENITKDSGVLLRLIFDVRNSFEKLLKKDLLLDLIEERVVSGNIFKRIFSFGRRMRYKKKYYYKVFYKDRKFFGNNTLFLVEFPDSPKTMFFLGGKINFKISEKYIIDIKHFITKSEFYNKSISISISKI